MTTATLERPVAPPEKVKIKSGKKPKKGSKKEVVLIEDVSFMKRAQKRAKKAYKKTMRLMKKAMRWMSKKSRKAYLRGMAWAKTAAKWTKAKAIAGASVVSAVASSTWVRATTAAAWAWSYTAPVFAWASTPTRAVVGSLLGLTIWQVFSATTVLTVGLGLLVYLALSSTRVTTRIVKVRHGRKVKKADKKVVEDLMGQETLALNPAQMEALQTLQNEVEEEREAKAAKGTVPQISNLTGQITLIRARMSGETGTVKDIFESYKLAMTEVGEWDRFDALAVSTGMRTANSKVDKLLVEHQTEAIVVEA